MKDKHKTLPRKPKRLDKDLFKACMFAKYMIDNGGPIGLAIYKAGQYYGYSAHDVASARNELKQARDKE